MHNAYSTPVAQFQFSLDRDAKISWGWHRFALKSAKKQILLTLRQVSELAIALSRLCDTWMWRLSPVMECETVFLPRPVLTYPFFIIVLVVGCEHDYSIHWELIFTIFFGNGRSWKKQTKKSTYQSTGSSAIAETATHGGSVSAKSGRRYSADNIGLSSIIVT